MMGRLLLLHQHSDHRHASTKGMRKRNGVRGLYQKSLKELHLFINQSVHQNTSEASDEICSFSVFLDSRLTYIEILTWVFAWR